MTKRKNKSRSPKLDAAQSAVAIFAAALDLDPSETPYLPANPARRVRSAKLKIKRKE